MSVRVMSNVRLEHPHLITDYFIVHTSNFIKLREHSYRREHILSFDVFPTLISSCL